MVRFSISSSSGMPPDKSIWLPVVGELKTNYQRISDQVNSRIISLGYENGNGNLSNQINGQYLVPNASMMAGPTIIGLPTHAQHNINSVVIPQIVAPNTNFYANNYTTQQQQQVYVYPQQQQQLIHFAPSAANPQQMAPANYSITPSQDY